MTRILSTLTDRCPFGSQGASCRLWRRPWSASSSPSHTLSRYSSQTLLLKALYLWAVKSFRWSRLSHVPHFDRFIQTSSNHAFVIIPLRICTTSNWLVMRRNLIEAISSKIPQLKVIKEQEQAKQPTIPFLSAPTENNLVLSPVQQQSSTGPSWFFIALAWVAIWKFLEIMSDWNQEGLSLPIISKASAGTLRRYLPDSHIIRPRSRSQELRRLKRDKSREYLSIWRICTSKSKPGNCIVRHFLNKMLFVAIWVAWRSETASRVAKKGHFWMKKKRNIF